MKNSNPLWSEDANLRFKDPTTSTLRVTLWDEHGAKESILGKVDLNLASFSANAAATQEWYPLSYASNNAYVSGELHVRVDLTQKDQGVVFVTVVEGRNLPLRTKSSTETFVRVSMGKQSAKTKVHKTHDKSSTHKAMIAEAEWNETVELKTADGVGDIVLFVYKQGISASCIGQVTISPFGIPEMCDVWVPLEVSPEMADKETSKASGKDSVAEIRLSVKVNRAIVYALEYYDPLLSLLMEEDSIANLVSVFDITTIKPEDRVTFAWHLVHVYEAKNRAPAILKALITREIQIAPDVETLFRANSLASKAVDMYMKICGHRYLQYCVQDTIEAIYKDGGKKCFELEPSKLEKADDPKKNWKSLAKYLDALLDRIFNSIDQCPAGMIQIFAHLQKEVEAKFADPNVRYTGVSSFLFLRLIVPAILGPKLFDLAPDHPSPKVAANLTAIGRIVQRIANMSPMDFAAKEYLREREFYIEKQKRPMQVFIDTLCQMATSLDFDPAAVDLQQELSYIQGHLESNLALIIPTLASESQASSRSAQRLLVCLDTMAAKSVKPRKATMVNNGTAEEPKWVLNPLFDCNTDRFNIDAISSSSTDSGSDNPNSGKLERKHRKLSDSPRSTSTSHLTSSSELVDARKHKSTKLDRLL